MPTVHDRFAAEIATFESRRKEWIATFGEGLWVAIRGDKTVGPTRVYEDLWRVAVDTLGRPGEFFVKRVFAVDRPVVISRIR